MLIRGQVHPFEVVSPITAVWLLSGCISPLPDAPPIMMMSSTGSSSSSSGGVHEPGSSDGGQSILLSAQDDTYLFYQNQTTNITAETGILANDIGVGLSLDEVGTSQASAAMTFESDGSFTYKPPDGWWGEDRFDYIVTDTSGATDTADVRVMVAPNYPSFTSVHRGVNGYSVTGDATSQLGSSMVPAGDVNGDGYEDIAISAPGIEGDAPYHRGAVFVVFGGPERPTSGINLDDLRDGRGGFVIDGEFDHGYAGVDVSSGDINGDGLDDILIGTVELGVYTNPQLGRSYVVFGKTDTDPVELSELSSSQLGGFIIEPPQSSANLVRVRDVGDVNGDGLDDIALGYLNFLNPSLEFSAIYVVFGKQDTLPIALATLDPGAQEPVGFEIVPVEFGDDASGSIHHAGDINGDGLHDLVIGARHGLSLSTSEPTGMAYLVFGKADGETVQLTDVAAGNGQGRAFVGEHAGDETGGAVSGGRDINGDGRSDLVITSGPFRDRHGRAYVVFGSERITPLQLGTLADPQTEGYVIDNALSISVTGSPFIVPSLIADINADGFDDIVLATTSGAQGYVVYGREGDAPIHLQDQPTTDWGFVFSPEQVANRVLLKGAGDLDGDGFGDLIGSARDFNDETGRVYVIYGGDYTLNATPPPQSEPVMVTGTDEAETFVGSRHNDKIDMGGGEDAVRAGAGDDTIVVPDERFRCIHGGRGEDTLVVTGPRLDLTTISDIAVSGIETIELRGHGVNEVRLSGSDLRALPLGQQRVTILGDAEDRVVSNILEDGFQPTEIAGCNVAYIQGVTTLCLGGDVENLIALQP